MQLACPTCGDPRGIKIAQFTAIAAIPALVRVRSSRAALP